MKCLRCQQDAPADAEFCPECGARLETVCAQCGAGNPSTHKFCTRCGGALAAAAPERREAARFASPETYTPKHLAEKILSSRSALEGERKQVSVLFADLKGSMELLADRDPEEARVILDPVLERMMEAVHRYEGTVNQVMGDGIMALFGAPVAHEDHAVRACYAALRIQESVTGHAEEVRRAHGVPIHVRVGLNSGEVVVRSIGSDLHMDYTAVGQTTHLAARMEQMAMPGSILITADCWRAAEGYVQAKPLGPVPVKGLSAPVEAYELTGAGAVRTRLQAAATRGLTRFTGREAELLRLHTALELAEGGHGQIIAIVGEPGVGKSRLLHEFIEFERTRGWLVLEAGAASYGRATPYLPVIDLLRGYFRVDDRDDHRAIREKVVGKLLALDPTLEPTLTALLALLDVPVEDPQWQEFDPLQRRRLTLDAVKRLLLRESQAQPLLLVFEDLHGIDSETQALLNGLVESIPTAPMLLAVTYRPEYQHRWGNKSYYMQLRIDPLPADSAGSLLAALVGEHATLRPLTELLVERTGGNPFFLEECVRTLVETGVLVGERGAYRVAREPQATQVPATVQAVLAARIDRLPPEEKRLLQSAAVIGKDVPLSLLQAIEEQPEDALRGSLAHLQAAEFLYETRLFPELEYTFKHALTQEVAYGALLQERRRLLHGRIVEAIELLHAGRLAEQVDRLAHHAARGELWAKAVTYLHQAGLKATARSASRDAVTFVEQALAALGRLPETPETIAQGIDLRFDLHSALIPLGDLDRILDVLRKAEWRAQELGDQHRLGRVSAFMATCYWWMGEPDRAVESGERARDIAAALGDAALDALTAQRLGQAYATLGEYQRAVDVLQRHVERPRGAPARERFGMAGLRSVTSRAWMAWCLGNLGEFAAGIRAADEAVRIAEAADDAYSLAVTYAGAGLPHLIQGNFAEAITWFERSADICQRAGFTPLYLLSASYLGHAHALSGRVADGLALLERVTAQSAAIKVIPTHVQALSFLGEAQLLAGRRAEALESALRAQRLIREHRQRFAEPDILRIRADVHASYAVPRVAEAEPLYMEALALAEALGTRPLVARVRLHLGTLYGRAGRPAPAREHLAAAREMLRDLQMRFWLEKADAALRALGGGRR